MTWIVCGGHHGTLVSMLAAELAGKTIAVDEISYTGGLEQARMLGAKLVGVAFDDEGMRADALREVCERERAAGAGVSAIYTMPTVHNPLGCVASLERRQADRGGGAGVRPADHCRTMRTAIWSRMRRRAMRCLAPERTFYMRGLSKSYAPATLTGFLVAPERFAASDSERSEESTTGTALVNNIAALSLVADGTVDAVIARKLEEGARRNAAARALLGEAAFPGARCAWHLWVASAGGLERGRGGGALSCQGRVGERRQLVRRAGSGGARVADWAGRRSGV